MRILKDHRRPMRSRGPSAPPIGVVGPKAVEQRISDIGHDNGMGLAPVTGELVGLDYLLGWLRKHHSKRQGIAQDGNTSQSETFFKRAGAFQAGARIGAETLFPMTDKA
jgi:hypothetical protein